MKTAGEVLISAREIRDKVHELGTRISRDYAGEDLLLVGILKGAFVFLADLVRAISIPVQLDFLGVASYGNGTASSEEVKVFKDLNQPVAGRNVLIVEDIVDSGLTIASLVQLLKVRNPRSIKVCSLLHKEARRKADIEVDYSGFAVPGKFLVGYGLDFDEKYRHLPDIHVLADHE